MWICSLLLLTTLISLSTKVNTDIDIGDTLDLTDVNYDETSMLLDEEIIKIFTLPCQDEGEILIKKMSTFAKILSIVKEELRCHNSKVFPSARNIYKRGKPQFLTSVFSRDTIFQTFRWSKEEAGLFDFVYHDCESLWNSFETIYKVHKIY